MTPGYNRNKNREFWSNTSQTAQNRRNFSGGFSLPSPNSSFIDKLLLQTARPQMCSSLRTVVVEKGRIAAILNNACIIFSTIKMDEMISLFEVYKNISYLNLLGINIA